MGPRYAAIVLLLLGVLLVPGSFSRAAFADDGEQILTIDHVLPHISTAPGIAGAPVELYVREKVQAGVALRSPSFAGKVVLLVHGLQVSAVPAFDVAHEDYSWMSYLAQAGLDVFAVDLTGVGGPLGRTSWTTPATSVLSSRRS